MATNWISIASADVNDYLNGPQISALRSVALAGGQADPFTNIMGAVIDRIRNKLKPRFQVSATAQTVPPELKQIACLLIIEQMSARLPQLKLTDDQKTLIKDAKDELKLIDQNEGSVTITAPSDAAAQDYQESTKVQVVTQTTRVATRDTLKGL